MIQIELADKTFKHYVCGERTFIHIPRNDNSLELKSTLQYGNEVVLKNRDTGDEITEIFWFLFDWKESERFLFLVFKWERYSPLFNLRKNIALKQWASGINLKDIYFERLPNYQKRSYHSLIAFSSLFFASIDRGTTCVGTLLSFHQDDEVEPILFSVTNVLHLRTEFDKIFFEVYSLFPVSLLD